MAVILWIASPAVTQTVKDPQQELTRLQEKVKAMQTADQQLKGQIATLKKVQENLEQDVRRSIAAGDSVMRAGLDSVRVANDRGLRNEQADASLRSSLALQQNLVIIALVLAVCLLLLFIWQRRMVRTLAQLHDADVKKLESMAEKQSMEMAAKIAELDKGLSSKIGGLQVSISDQSKRTEEQFAAVAVQLSSGIGNLREELHQTCGKIVSDHRYDIEGEKKSREDAVSELIRKVSAVDEKAETGMTGAMSFMKQETESYRKELADLKKAMQDAARNPKGRGTSAE
jgi:hypothetical protein